VRRQEGQEGEKGEGAEYRRFSRMEVRTAFGYHGDHDELGSEALNGGRTAPGWGTYSLFRKGRKPGIGGIAIVEEKPFSICVDRMRPDQWGD